MVFVCFCLEEEDHMELRFSFLPRKCFSFILLCVFLFHQQSAGVSLPSLSLASLFLPNEVKTPDLNLYGRDHRTMLLQRDISLSPASTHTSFVRKAYESLSPAPAPQVKTFHFRAPTKTRMHGSAPSSPVSPHKNRHDGKTFHHVSPEPYHHIPPSSNIRKRHVISPSPSPLPSSGGTISRGHFPLPAIPPNHLNVPSSSPATSPLTSSMRNNENTLPPLPSLILPPPPPNQGCPSLTCSDPLTYTIPGVPCGCVWPIEVRLRFSVSLYTFLPLVSELSKEISASLPLNRSQVRIMGADAADQEKTNILLNLVPLDANFNATTAYSIYSRFWNREVSIKSSTFGAYHVLYVRYPGLPPSPPSQLSGSTTIDVQPYPGGMNGDKPIKPLGVDLPTRRRNESQKNMAIVIVLSSVTAFVVFMGCTMILFSKMGCCSCFYRQTPLGLVDSEGKPSGGDRLLTFRSKASSASMSFSSSLLAYTGTAKVFSIDEIERATDNFKASRILGEGGFGLVYGGILDDGREVAVKILKREDQQGSREFLAEVEMLGRLHHRNLVKLIGICPEDHCRCLVYDLVPNGSVESHLHGVDKEIAPLDWCSRMKIALGSARGLAYLHEDSSPRVIHRDFKSSNILLEKDFTPKVSDFGLARTAMDEGNKHISTHVMGTFGYLAPEYAMTGHLLVKSDVYSYGVVLLELLTGRKPVDLSQPPGQENLVAWARPLLAVKEGLEIIIDPALKLDFPLESIAKVAAIASMCVQPEVSHRPFMGEVVQALKLVCDEFEETREYMSRNCSQEDISIDMDNNKYGRLSNELVDAFEKRDSSFDAKVALSAVDLKSASVGFGGQESESFRRQFNSAPLKMERKRKFWERLRYLSRGSMSEHEISSNF